MSGPGLRALMEREGFKNRAYPDPATGGAPWTIGVGHTGPEVHSGLYWDDETVKAALAKDVAKFEAAVSAAVKVPLAQNQFDALVSWTHNVGEGAMSSSTLVRMLNERNYKGASAQFRRWIVPAMITARRAGEWVQFNTPDGKPYPARSEFDDRYP